MVTELDNTIKISDKIRCPHEKYEPKRHNYIKTSSQHGNKSNISLRIAS
jgi:hypothetical protein